MMVKNGKFIWIGVGVIIVAILFMQGKKEIGVGCIGPTQYNNCNWILDTYQQTTGQSPNRLYVFGWHTSSCTGNNYAACIDTPSTSCGGDSTDTLLNTCSYGGSTGCDGNPEGSMQCGTSGGSAVTQKCINGQWVNQETCPYACSLGSCLSSPCNSPDAAIGKYTCKSGDVVKCTSTSVWTKINDCESYSGYTTPCKNEAIARNTESDAKLDCTTRTCTPMNDVLTSIGQWKTQSLTMDNLLSKIAAWKLNPC